MLGLGLGIPKIKSYKKASLLDIGDVLAYYNVDKLTFLETDGTGNVSDGGSLGYWGDSSGNFEELKSPADGNRIIYQTDAGPDGGPCIDATTLGIGEYLITDSNFPVTDSLTIAGTFRQSNAPGFRGTFIDTNTTKPGGSGAGLTLERYDLDTRISMRIGVSGGGLNSTIAADTWYQFLITYDGTTGENIVRINKAQTATANLNTTLLHGRLSLGVYNNISVYGNFMTTDLIFYGKKLNAEEIDLVEAYITSLRGV